MRWYLALAIACLAGAALGAEPARRPNIILILADDLGYGDVGVTYQNGRAASQPKFATPNLDRMAAEGTLLRQHYTGAPVCAPARASLLLGQHQGHCPVRDNQFDKALPASHNLATVLQAAGYHTGVIGKWGLQGQKPDYPGHPLKRGFDEFFGFLEHVSGHTYYHDAAHPLRDNYDEVTAKYADVYSTDLFTARAKRFIGDHVASKPAEPFFLYLAYTAVHNALNVPGGPYPAGAGKAGGMQWPLAPTPQTRDTWIHPDYAAQPWTDPMKRYATMARRLDDGVGDVLQLLRDLGIDRDTLVVFTSDNGPANEGGADPRLFDSWGPFDGFKRDCFEGGVREPTIAWGPGRVRAGQTSDLISGFWDWMPTFAEAAGLVPPAQTDGVSLLPTLLGTGTQRSRGFAYVEYFVAGKNAASADVFARKHTTGRGQQQFLRVGDYAVVRTQIKTADDPLRLYDVAIDPHEDHDLAADPAQAARLKQMRDLLAGVHRPEPSAPRPYDAQPLPAVTPPAALAEGALTVSTYEGEWPWVPDLDALPAEAMARAAGIAPATDLRAGALRLTGYLRAPADGDYTFHLTADGGADLWLHDARLIDDAGRAPSAAEATATVPLKSGLHPFRLFYRHVPGPAKLSLEWSGPGIERQPVPASAFATGTP